MTSTPTPPQPALDLEKTERFAVRNGFVNGSAAVSLIATIRALQAERDALREALEPFASIEVPHNASSGTWVARTLYCNNQVTAHSVEKARAALAASRKGE